MEDTSSVGDMDGPPPSNTRMIGTSDHVAPDVGGVKFTSAITHNNIDIQLRLLCRATF